jgi:hypothetical protein
MMAGSTVIGTVQFAVCWDPHSFAHCTTVSVRCLFTIVKEGAGRSSLWVADMFCTKQTFSSLHNEVLLMTMKTLYSECLPSGDLYPVICLTSKNCMVSDWTNKKTTVLWLYFCHQTHSVINA